jgi:hypothetical protein
VILEKIHPRMDNTPPVLHLCREICLKTSTPVLSSESIRTVNPNLGSTTQPHTHPRADNNTPGTTSTRATGSTSGPLGTKPIDQSQSTSNTASVATQPYISIGIPSSSKIYILFGVKGSRPSILELDHLDIDETKTTDRIMYQDLKKSYRKRRGRLRRWFWCWRFEYCSFVRVSFIIIQLPILSSSLS